MPAHDNDPLFGGTGADGLSGGIGNDTLRGDAGDDLFSYLFHDEGGVVILDFTKRQDKIQVYVPSSAAA